MKLLTLQIFSISITVRIMKYILEFQRWVAPQRVLAKFAQRKPVGHITESGTAPTRWSPPTQTQRFGFTLYCITIHGKWDNPIPIKLTVWCPKLTAALWVSNQGKRRCNLGPAAATAPSEDMLLQNRKLESDTLICCKEVFFPTNPLLLWRNQAYTTLDYSHC